MSYMNRLWMATSVAVVNCHSDQVLKLKSGLKSVNHGRKWFFSGRGILDAAELRPCSAVVNSEVVRGFLGGDKRKQADESVRQVMYLNCWAHG